MPKFAAQVDGNQSIIVETLRKAGYAVLHLHAVGRGCPDLLVSKGQDMWLVEVKLPKGKLNDRQVEFHSKWHGKPIVIVHSPEEALLLLQ